MAFEEAVALSGDPVYVTGSYWGRCGPGRGIVVPLGASGGPAAGGSAPVPGLHPLQQGRVTSPRSGGTRSLARGLFGGLLDLMERRRRGATLEQALALFPSWGDEWEPCPPAVTTGTN